VFLEFLGIDDVETANVRNCLFYGSVKRNSIWPFVIDSSVINYGPVI
jgi:hypothetical protein